MCITVGLIVAWWCLSDLQGQIGYWWRRLTKRFRYYKSSRFHREPSLLSFQVYKRRRIKACSSYLGLYSAPHKQCLAYPSSIAASPDQFKEPTMLQKWDSDSFVIGIDNHASRCMDPNIKHFTDILKCGNKVTKGIASGLPIIAYGTVHWNIEDDHGVVHHMTIPNSACVARLPHCLLSPQHWSQEANDQFPIANGTYAEQHHDKCILIWDQRKLQRTIPLDPFTNCPTLNSAPGFHLCQVFMAHLESKSHRTPPAEIISYVNSISASEGESEDDGDGDTAQDGHHQHQAADDKAHTYEISLVPPDQTDDQDGHLPLHAPALPPHIPSVDDDAAIAVQDPQADLLRWHYRLNHTPFSKLIAMSKQGILP